VKWTFPEDRLRELSHPTDDMEFFFLKALLATQPENRPTAANALSHAWSADLKSDDDCYGDDEVETIQSGYRSMLGRKRENRLATQDRPNKRSERNQISAANTRRVPGSVNSSSGPGSQRGGGPATRKPQLTLPWRHYHHRMQRLPRALGSRLAPRNQNWCMATSRPLIQRAPMY